MKHASTGPSIASTARPYAPRRRAPLALVKCSFCPRMTATLRAGKCPVCAVRASRGRLFTDPCAACGASDPRVLRRHTLADGPAVVCANCSAIAGRRPLALAELRAELGEPAAA